MLLKMTRVLILIILSMLRLSPGPGESELRGPGGRFHLDCSANKHEINFTTIASLQQSHTWDAAAVQFFNTS